MPVPALPPLPPRSATEIIDGAVQLVRPEFGYFLRIAALGAIPDLVTRLVMLLVFPTTSGAPEVMLRRELIVLLFSILFATVQSGAILTAAFARLQGDLQPTVGRSFAVAFRRTPALLGAFIILLVAVALLALPLVFGSGLLVAVSGTALQSFVAGGSGTVIAVLVSIAVLAVFFFLLFLLYARWAITTVLVIVEQLGPFAAVRRAQTLATGSNLRLAGTYALTTVITVVVYAIIAGLGLTVLKEQNAIQSLAGILLVPVVPILGAIMLLSYADLRVRREGADLDAALDALTGLPARG